MENGHWECQIEDMDDRAFFWSLPVIMAASVALQIRCGRLGLLSAPKEWRNVRRESDPGRFWLFIVAETLAVFILIGQALDH